MCPVTTPAVLQPRSDLDVEAVLHDVDARRSMHEAITVQLLLEEPLLRDAVVHAVDLERSVDWCLPLAEAVTEHAGLDGVVVVAHEELCLLGVDDAATRVRWLGEQGVSALVVSTPGPVPDWLPRLAGQYAVPLILPPQGVSYRAISRLIGEKSLVRSAHIMAYGVSVQKELADVLYRGAGLSAMAQRVSRLSSRPIFVLGSQFDVLAYESLTATPVPDPDELVRTLQKMVESGAVDPAPHDHDRAAVLVELLLEQGPVSCVVAPIVLGGSSYGWVAIVEIEQPPHRHDISQHLVLAQQASMVAGSEMLRLHSVEEAQERARGDFVHALLHERFASPHEMAGRAAFHGFDISATYVVVVAAGVIDPASSEGVARQRRLAREIQRLDVVTESSLITSVGNILVVVRRIGSGRQRAPDVKKEHDLAAEYAASLEPLLATGSKGEVSVAYGRPGVGQQGVMASYREARIALEIASRVHRHGISGYADLRVLAVLSALAQQPDAVAFAHEVMSPLEPVGRSDSDLRSVVTAYLENGGNLNATSRQLYMHRNTVLYKIDKAAQLLGMDLRAADSQFTLWLAHQIETLSEVEAAVDLELNPGG